MIVSGFSWIFSWGGWLWANDVSVPRKVTPGLPGWIFFCTVPRPHFLGRALIWPGYFGEHVLGLFALYPSNLSKSVGFVSLSGKASLVSIYAAILSLRSWLVYFPLEFEFRGKSCVERGAWRRKWHLVSPTLYIIIVYRVNLNKLSRNFVGALRTTTTNCRASFSDLYSVFPRNFRIVFLPYTNTLILLEPYCGTITEPGLPVEALFHYVCVGRYLSKKR